VYEYDRQVAEHHICLIVDESHLIISSKPEIGKKTGRLVTLFISRNERYELLPER